MPGQAVANQAPSGENATLSASDVRLVNVSISVNVEDSDDVFSQTLTLFQSSPAEAMKRLSGLHAKSLTLSVWSSKV